MKRKILVEVTEEEYEKIKNGILEKEPEVVTKVKEVPVVKTKKIPVIMDNRFKFSIGDKVSFIETNMCEGEIKREGKVVGVSLTTRPPFELERSAEDEVTPLYIIEYIDDDFTYISQFRENEITLIPKENTDEHKS